MEEGEVQEEKEELGVVSPTIRQIIHSNLGMFGSRGMGDDLVYLRFSVMMLLSDVGPEVVKEKYGEKWFNTLMIKLKQLGILLNKVKIFYDSIKDKKMSEEKKELLIKKCYKEALSKVPLIDIWLFFAFVKLIKLSKLRYLTVPSEFFKIVEREYKTFQFKPKEKTEEGE